MADRVGQQLGNYQLQRLIGTGGFAEVYLAEHKYLRTHAAIKILHTQLATDDQGVFSCRGTYRCSSHSTTYYSRAGIWHRRRDAVLSHGLRS